MAKNSHSKTYKYCMVPCCTNTTFNAMEKLFFSVPKDKKKRKQWTTAMNRDLKLPELSNISSLYVCEDHFTIEEDMKNYWQWKLTASVKKLELKAGTIPHKFECQKKISSVKIERQGFIKRRRLSLIEDAMQSYSSTAKIAEFSEVENMDETLDTTNEKGVQVMRRKKFRSKANNTAEKVISVACSPMKRLSTSVGVNTSPAVDSPEACSTLSEFSNSESEFNLDVDESDNYSSDENLKDLKHNEILIKGTILSIEKKPKLFLGLPQNSLFLLELLSKRSKLPLNHIYIVLKKIKLNESFEILAIQFGLSTSTVSRIFSKSLPRISILLQELIFWPDENDVKKHLPIPFRLKYYKVISIIDCFEIEIEKPSNPVHQAQTWSNYYKCNTAKYLISCTPDGLVNFVSHGYGGRASHLAITKDSGYLNNLTAGQQVMAGRGFKNISNLLEKKGCQLVRLPSVSASARSTKFENKQSKQIAALRTHVEKVIGRIRKFKLLLPHACVDNHLIDHLDNILLITCALINMQFN